MSETLTKSAPAKVVPIALRNRFFLNFFTLKGMDPTMMTMPMKRSMNATLRMASTSLSYIFTIDSIDIIQLKHGLLSKLFSSYQSHSYDNLENGDISTSDG